MVAGSLSNLRCHSPRSLSWRSGRHTATAGHRDNRSCRTCRGPRLRGLQAGDVAALWPSGRWNSWGQHHSLSSDDVLHVVSLAPFPLALALWTCGLYRTTRLGRPVPTTAPRMASKTGGTGVRSANTPERGAPRCHSNSPAGVRLSVKMTVQ